MNILFFASLRESLNTESEQWQDLQGAQTAGDVLSQLKQRGEPWQTALGNEQLIISVNQEVSNVQTNIKLGDELAFFPPVTGG
jgi:molybdopterin synthase sulfur carrier subunit